jgi:hypothetical protein
MINQVSLTSMNVVLFLALENIIRRIEAVEVTMCIQPDPTEEVLAKGIPIVSIMDWKPACGQILSLLES